MSNVLPFARPDDAKAPTVSKIVEAYLADQQSELPARTFQQRERYARRFALAFGVRPYDSLRPSEVKQWLVGLGLAPNTQTTLLRILKRVFNWAVNDRLISFNPMRGLNVQAGDPRRATTDKEFQVMLRACLRVFRPVLVWLRATGARPGEAAALRWEWIDWSLRCAVIPATHHKTGRKTGKPRLIPLASVAFKLLLWLRRERGQPTAGVVFLNSRGSPWTTSSMFDRLESIRRVTGLDPGATLHGIRHLWACNALRETGDLKGVSRSLGHDRVQTTEASYLHVGREEVEAMLRVAEKGSKRK